MSEERDWIFHRGDRTTTLIRVLGGNRLAVARSFLSDNDAYDRKKGRLIASGRMEKYLKVYQEESAYSRRDQGDQRTIFEVTGPDSLPQDEKDFFYRTIQKSIEKRLDAKGL